MLAQAPQRIADAAAAGSGVLAGAAWLAELTPALTILATLVAIVAGVCAAWFHIEKALLVRKQRQRK